MGITFRVREAPCLVAILKQEVRSLLESRAVGAASPGEAGHPRFGPLYVIRKMYLRA